MIFFLCTAMLHSLYMVLHFASSTGYLQTFCKFWFKGDSCTRPFITVEKQEHSWRKNFYTSLKKMSDTNNDMGMGRGTNGTDILKHHKKVSR